MRGRETLVRHGVPAGRAAGVRCFSVDYSHAAIGVRYLGVAMLLMAAGGTPSMLIRTGLLDAGWLFLDPAIHTTLIGMDGWSMIAAILVGVADVAFPRSHAGMVPVFAYATEVVPGR